METRLGGATSPWKDTRTTMKSALPPSTIWRTAATNRLGSSRGQGRGAPGKRRLSTALAALDRAAAAFWKPAGYMTAGAATLHDPGRRIPGLRRAHPADRGQSPAKDEGAAYRPASSSLRSATMSSTAAPSRT